MPKKIIFSDDLHAFYLKILPFLGKGSSSEGGGGHTIENSSGTDLTQRDTLQFGEGFNASDDSTNEKTVVEPNLMASSDMDDVVNPLPSVTPVPSGGGSNPTGTIIAFMGTTAPSGYLACDGTVYNIADHSALANFFEAQFGTKNNFGGNGTTTFAVPDLSGEFLRGTGTNSHAFSGSGASVGVHQNPTQLPGFWHEGANRVYMGTSNSFDSASNNFMYNDKDTYVTPGDIGGTIRKAQAISTSDRDDQHSDWVFGLTIRPTNTSVLYCIKE